MGLLEETEQPVKSPQVVTERRNWLARWVSIIIHPIAFPLVTLFLVAFEATHSLPASLRYTGWATLLTSVPITLLVSVQVLRGKWTDLDVSVRKQRYQLYPFGLACMLALAALFIVVGAPGICVRAALAIVLANIVDGVINFIYKVSAHATGAAVCATILWAAVPLWGIVAAILALAVGWSRVALGRHTGGQVALGWAVGAGSTLALLMANIPGILPA